MPAFPPLALPPVAVQQRQAAGRAELFDPVRRRWVAATPEEWVRQHLVAFLVAHRGVPPGLVAVERAVPHPTLPRRADVLVYGPDGRARLLVECKAPTVALGQAVFAQAARYAKVLAAPYVLVTNGLSHACYRIAGEALVFEPDVPPWETLRERTFDV